ncbi:MAG: tetratricopeptide repeat protein [Leptospiraceae bacterium]|nr:tetratricopeptide repeat protein [Leptospiraceae bacterium]
MFNPNSFRIQFLLQLFLVFSIYAETIKIGEDEFQLEPFVQEMETETNGSMTLTDNDFVICKGKNFSGDPPSSRGSFEFEGKKITSLPDFNNELVSLLNSDSPDRLNRAYEMAKAGYEFDPVFFPIVYNYGRIESIRKDFKNAEKIFLKANALMKKYYRTMIHLGLVQDRLGKFQESVQNLQLAAKENPFSDEARLYLCEIYAKTGHPRSYHRFPKLSYPFQRKVNESICEGMIEYYKRNFPKAYKVFRRIQIPNSDKPFQYSAKLHLLFAESALEVFDLKTAVQEWSKVLEFPFDSVFFDTSEFTLRRKIKTYTEIK